ncbi:hypothetical protein PENTCL1PPCAC_10818, partial [Pristionchus entomophagus]
MLLTSFYFPPRCTVNSPPRPLSQQDDLPSSLRPAPSLLLHCRDCGGEDGLAMLFEVEDDAHIGEILRSKFTDFASFHTRLYTCSAEFGFIQQETLEKLTNTGLLPTALTSFLLIALFLVRSRPVMWRDASSRLRPLSHLPYHAAQTAAFVFL